MYRTSAVLNVALIAVAFGAAIPAASSNSKTAGASPTQQFATQNESQTQSNDKTEVKTFSGTIWMNGDRFVLRDEREKRWYHLDADQKLIAKFEGKEVKVTGTLDPTTSEIHVQRIEEG
ncbi:MAG: DUF5818 domain-containing protein [Candidatus Acidiferrales bacterium]